MSGGKEIKGQISSIKNTQKITKAMEMVAASKMKKAQGRMSSARPYAKMIKNVVGHLASAHPEYKHPFLVKRDSVKRVGLIVVSSDRGLCGGLNTNLFKKALKQIDDWNKNSIEVDVCAIGSKAEKFFKRLNVNPGAKLSLQLHYKRAEHWVVVSGEATVCRGKEMFTLKKGESCYIPIETKHSLENKTQKSLELIEVQSGSYLGEDDIVRFEDIYGR